jgi:hypothetical protein
VSQHELPGVRPGRLLSRLGLGAQVPPRGGRGRVGLPPCDGLVSSLADQAESRGGPAVRKYTARALKKRDKRLRSADPLVRGPGSGPVHWNWRKY